MVVADGGWPGLVLKIAIGDIRKSNGSPARQAFEVGAGVDWDEFVMRSVAEKCAGVECLSGIPGTAGGTPVQNVGAYGQEVSETITSVRVCEIATERILDLEREQCGFSYRTSIFNSTQRGRYIVLRVNFSLSPGGTPSIQYGDLKRFFADRRTPPSLLETRDAVREIRRSKAMLIVPGEDDCRSAGSFFKNPVVNSELAEKISAWAGARKLQLPQYPSGDGGIKLPAAWLVEQAGFSKGYTKGPVGISRKHSLAIVNRGGATAQDILGLGTEIQGRVAEIFGLELHREPVLVGFDLDRPGPGES